MARTKRNEKLDTRSSRAKLPAQKNVYWTALAPGCAVGYRKGTKGGVWLVKLVRDGQRKEATLGPADDILDADGVNALSYAEAQAKARDWLSQIGREQAAGFEPSSGPYTVGSALDDYLMEYERRGGKAAGRVRNAIDAHIKPELGAIALAKLTRPRLEKWQAALIATPPRLRTKKGEAQKFRELDTSPEAVRRRKATANKVLAILKAALNHAVDNKRAMSADAWAPVKPYREANAPKVRYLKDDESKRLVNACQGAFRGLVTAALMTGCRYGELAAMTVGAFDGDNGSVYIPKSKSGKERHVHLTDEGRDFFTASARGKASDGLLFPREDGGAWGQAHQFRPMLEACKNAKIAPAIGFHILRHTYASRLAMRGVPLPVIAAQLGHSDTRMTEKHYAHLAPSYVADTVRAAFGNMGLVEPSNVQSIRVAAV